MRHLKASGHDVIGAGRGVEASRRRLPRFPWVHADLRRTTAADWAGLLIGVDAVVNAAGSLQDGLGDDMTAVHIEGLGTLIEGCRQAGVHHLVHISAVGVTPGRGGSFNETKAKGEAVVRASGLDWTILRPALVMASQAYGGGALLRGLASFPFVIPAIAVNSAVQTVGIDVLSQAVVAAVEGRSGSGQTLELAGAETLPLAELLQRLRAWLGLPPAPVIEIPGPLIGVVSLAADGLGRLGWRSAMRSNAVDQQTKGMHSPGGGEATLGLPAQTLDEILDAMPSNLQERRFARLYFVKPAVLILLGLFCAYSGILGLTAGYDAAIGMLAAGGVASPLKEVLLIGGCIADILLAMGLLVRRSAPLALKGIIAISLAYLVAGSWLRPDLWLDPLAALAKAGAVAMLALVGLAMMDER